MVNVLVLYLWSCTIYINNLGTTWLKLKLVALKEEEDSDLGGV